MKTHLGRGLDSLERKLESPLDPDADPDADAAVIA